MKKILIALCISALLVATFASCGGNTENNSSDVAGNSSVVDDSSDIADDSSDVTDESSDEGTVDGAVDAKLSEINNKVKEIYDENYLASMPISVEMLTDIYGFNVDNYESFIAEGPVMSAHVDTFIGIKAKEGKAADIEAELNAYRTSQVENTMMYPMNIAKVNASKVYVKGDYIFFLMLGAYGDETASEADALAFAQAEVQKAVDAIDEILG